MPLFDHLATLWSDWKLGIPPGREWTARGGQNPRLLAAFAALDRGKCRAECEAAEARAQAARVAQAAAERRRR